METPSSRQFNSVEEECYYWKELAKLYMQEKADCQQEFENFTDESRQLENELEATLLQNEKQIRDLNTSIHNLRDENDSLRHKIISLERDTTSFETQFNQVATERDNLKAYIRELEQKNDDLERTNRVVSESVAGFEAMLNQAYEKNALLEMEVDEKENMQVNLQRLMDEARDLKQELKIRNITLPPKPAKGPDSLTDHSLTVLSKDIARSDDVSKNNDINDSKNNNLNVLDKTNNSFSDTLNSTSASSNNTLKSLSEHPQNKSLSKYDCNLSTSNPIAASTKVSALNIVADLLKKLDNLEAKLKAWKTQKPASQRLIESTMSNNISSSSIDTLEKIKK